MQRLLNVCGAAIISMPCRFRTPWVFQTCHIANHFSDSWCKNECFVHIFLKLVWDHGFCFPYSVTENRKVSWCNAISDSSKPLTTFNQRSFSWSRRYVTIGWRVSETVSRKVSVMAGHYTLSVCVCFSHTLFKVPDKVPIRQRTTCLLFFSFYSSLHN